MPVRDADDVHSCIPQIGVLDEDREGQEAAIGSAHRRGFRRRAGPPQIASRLAAIPDCVPPQRSVIKALEAKTVAGGAADVRPENVDTDAVHQMDDRSELAPALSLGPTVELDHRWPRAPVDSVQQTMNLEAIEGPVSGFGRLDQVFEPRVVADLGPAAIRRPFVNLGWMRRMLPAREHRSAVVTPAEV